MGDEAGTETKSTEDGTKIGVENLTEKVVDDPTSDDDKAKKEKAEKEKAEKEKEGALSDADQASLKTVKSLLDEYEISSPEDLKDFVGRLATLKDQMGDADLEELKANSDLLKRYQKAWASEKEKEKEDGETPEQTIDRLKREKRVDRDKLKAKDAEQEEAREDKALLKSFNNTVKSTVKAQADLPAAYHGILTEFLGIDNEIHEIDLNDKAAIKRVTKAATKKIMDFEQSVIKRYLAGKAKVPKITKTTDSPSDAPVKITSKNAKAIAIERLKGFLGKK